MMDPNHIPPVADDELLTRFITQAKQFRPGDQTVKPDLFIPFRLTQLSVTRHRAATAEELWGIGREVAALRQQTLYGRSEIRASDCASCPLSIVPDPILPPDAPYNPNHANIIGFPSAKPDQEALAIKIAHKASNRIPPP
ncbi:MAG: hypothetical protein HUU20_13805 [Pirellulales bacterium]|nr:hypothetical protein [Pirellulales bacterium]